MRALGADAVVCCLPRSGASLGCSLALAAVMVSSAGNGLAALGGSGVGDPAPGGWVAGTSEASNEAVC